MKNFSSLSMREFLAKRGLETKVEEDGRVFPVSDVGQDVVDLFERELRKAGVEIRLAETVKKVQLGVGTAKKFAIYNNADQKELFDQVVFAIGGNAFSQTGSTGDGYAWARDLGHQVTQLGPFFDVLCCGWRGGGFGWGDV